MGEIVTQHPCSQALFTILNNFLSWLTGDRGVGEGPSTRTACQVLITCRRKEVEKRRGRALAKRSGNKVIQSIPK